MIHVKHTIIMLFISFSALAQYDYAELTTVQVGIKNKAEVYFYFTNEDSTKHYNNLKIKHIITGIELLENKGFEVVSIVSSNYSGAGITSAYMRRKKQKSPL